MNIIDYIDKYKNLTFKEKELNELDKLIFSLLSYIDYNAIVSKNEKNKKSIETVGEEYFNINSEKEIKKNFLPIRNAIKVLDSIRNTKRYKDLLLYNYVYLANDNQQFSALTIEIDKNLLYVSFEGTDHLISGWEEDFKMSYKFPIPAHKEAIRYLNKRFKFKDCNIIVGGHSKGGNLSLVSSMYCNRKVQKKIININSYDGPGLRKKQLDSFRYKAIKDRYNLILNSNSIVGLLLLNDGNYNVVKTNKIGILAHDAFYWEVEDDKFILEDLNNSSLLFQKSLLMWLDKYTDKDRRKFVKYIFEIFKENDIISLREILEDYKHLINIFKSIKEVDSIVIEMTKEFIKILLDCNKEYIKDKIDDLTNLDSML